MWGKRVGPDPNETRCGGRSVGGRACFIIPSFLLLHALIFLYIFFPRQMIRIWPRKGHDHIQTGHRRPLNTNAAAAAAAPAAAASSPVSANGGGQNSDSNKQGGGRSQRYTKGGSLDSRYQQQQQQQQQQQHQMIYQQQPHLHPHLLGPPANGWSPSEASLAPPPQAQTASSVSGLVESNGV